MRFRNILQDSVREFYCGSSRISLTTNLLYTLLPRVPLGITFWIPRTFAGSRFLGLESWIPGLGFLDLAENLDLLPEVIKPITFSSNLQIVRSPLTKAGRIAGEGSPETRSFLNSLHKLAHALQTTITW